MEVSPLSISSDAIKYAWKTGSPASHGHRVTVVVAGELWEAAAVARTRQSLRLEGLEPIGYRVPFGRETKPLRYGEVVGRLATECAGERILVVPAGMAAREGFGEALQRWSEAPSADCEPVEVGGKRRVLAALEPSHAGSPRRWREVGPELTSMLVDLGLQVGKGGGAVIYRTGRALRRPEGADTYQRLSELGLTARLEAPVRVLGQQELETAGEGWVYRCNNELLEPDLSGAKGCDALVTVAAGIKPWHIANELRNTLRRVVVLDAEMAQLGFAYRAFRSFEQPGTWREMCDALRYRSVTDEHLCRSHERLFRRIGRGRGEWKFELEFVLADIVSQTFGLVEHLKRRGVVRPVFWYSNIFQPYVGEGRAEHHAGLEHSFVTLIRREFPEAVFFAAGRQPVLDPLAKTLYPGFLFRARRFLTRRFF